ncbi:MAG TPA: hypothetical protein VM186_10980 [Planctomycetota bacterium]|nr:hypothetical protein [Planctomycetota bacterium]
MQNPPVAMIRPMMKARKLRSPRLDLNESSRPVVPATGESAGASAAGSFIRQNAAIDATVMALAAM